MSTDISDERSAIPFHSRAILGDMAKRVETLSEYIQRIFRKKPDLSLKKVERQSRGGISAGYVNDLIQEKTVNPTIKALKGLALGLDEPEDEVFAVARGIQLDEAGRLNAHVAHLSKQLDDLTGADREWLIEMIEMISSQLDKRRSRSEKK